MLGDTHRSPSRIEPAEVTNSRLHYADQTPDVTRLALVERWQALTGTPAVECTVARVLCSFGTLRFGGGAA